MLSDDHRPKPALASRIGLEPLPVAFGHPVGAIDSRGANEMAAMRLRDDVLLRPKAEHVDRL